MSLADVEHEQRTHRCACVRLRSRDCIQARYPRPWDEDDEDSDERCECSCHDGEYEDDDDEDYDP